MKLYTDRTDLEKIKSNWTKTKGLFKREEYSGAIIRATTACEIAANYVIRQSLYEENKLKKEFVDSLLIWANGLQGKLDRLILPLFKNTRRHARFKKLKSKITEINKERNSIVHSGQFKKKSTTQRILEKCRQVINALVTSYDIEFRLKRLDF